MAIFATVVIPFYKGTAALPLAWHPGQFSFARLTCWALHGPLKAVAAGALWEERVRMANFTTIVPIIYDGTLALPLAWHP